MTPWRIVFVVGVIAVLLTGGTHYRLEQGRRREASRLRQENDRLRWRIARQHPVTSPVGAVPLPASSVATDNAAASSTPSADVPQRADLEYRNAGQATPTDTLQTLAWACDRADTKTVEALVVFDDTARIKTVAYLATLPAERRAQWTSPEVAAAAVLVSRASRAPFPLPGVLARTRIEAIGPDRVLVRLPDTSWDGMEFRRTASGWTYSITEQEVDDFLADQAASRR